MFTVTDLTFTHLLKTLGSCCLEENTSFFIITAKRIVESVLRPPDSFQVTTTNGMPGAMIDSDQIVVQTIYVISGSKSHTPRMYQLEIHLCFVFAPIFDYLFYVSFHFDVAVYIGDRYCLVTSLLIEHMSS